MNGRWIIYPETRFMTEAQIRMALSDAIANGEVVLMGETVESVGIETAIQLLDDTGRYTFTVNGVSDSLAEQAHADNLLRD